MRDILAYLEEREAEFARHMKVARILEARVSDGETEENQRIEIRHINTVKSGLVIHLYNIVEAVTTRTLREIGLTIIADQPKRWTAQILKEWVRGEIWSGEERIGEGALTRLTNVSHALVSGRSPPAFLIKGEPGSWDDTAIKKVADRLGCSLSLSPDIRRAAYERSYRNDTTAMGYLAQRRNDIAHGSTTFEEGVHDLTLNELSNLSEKVISYLRAVTESYQTFLDSKAYLGTENATS